MPILIDGHNLIPHVPGLSLSAMDDEQALIRWLQAYCQARRKPVEVYFDRAAPGHAGQHTFGMVKATFVPTNSTADEAIRQRLAKMGRSARNWMVITSDRQVQSEARSRGASVRGSEDFARELVRIVEAQPGGGRVADQLSPEDVEAWLRIFNSKEDKSD